MELHRRKTDDTGVWDLEVNGEIVGKAERWFISPTQPRWKLTAHVNGAGYLIENAASVRKGLAELETMIVATNQVAATSTRTSVTA